MDLKLDVATNDVEVLNGDLVLLADDGAVRQRLKQRLLLFLGEWFLDASKGVPYYQYILVKNPNMDLVNSSLKAVVLQTPGILELTSFDYDYDSGGRGLTVTCQCKGANGDFVVDAGVGI